MPKPTIRKYRPRKEMPLSEVKRLVAAAHLRQMERLGMPQPKKRWGKFNFGCSAYKTKIDDE